MKRSIIKHGPSSYVISLPSSWIKKHDIKKGNEIDVVEQGNHLVVGNNISPGELEANVDLTGLDRSAILFVIRGFYRLGYKTLNIRFENTTTKYQRAKTPVTVLSVIHSEVNRLIGYEVISEKENSCVIKDLQKDSIEEFENTLKHVFILLLSAMEDFKKGVKNKDNNILETMEEKHNTVTKFVSYCLRLLNINNYPVPRKAPYYFHVISCIENIIDIIKYLSRDIRKSNKKLDKKVINIIDITSENIKTLYDFFYKYSKDKINSIHDSWYVIEKIITQLPEKSSKIDIITASKMFDIVYLICIITEAKGALSNSH